MPSKSASVCGSVSRPFRASCLKSRRPNADTWRALAHLQAAHPSLTAEDALANAHIYVRADLDVAYDRVVHVVDALQRARFRNVAISAQQA